MESRADDIFRIARRGADGEIGDELVELAEATRKPRRAFSVGERQRCDRGGGLD